MNKLINILDKFEQNRKNWKGSQWDEKAVAECFMPCAENILLGGYFLVNDKYIIDLGAIELYYHEEEGDIKDYIMYHIPERYCNTKSKVVKLENEKGINLPYFTFGSFNLHQSGVDVTFEMPKKYRASFLIRAYRVFLKGDDRVNDLSLPFDWCYTHIFDDMFYEGVSFKATNIQWVELAKPITAKIENCPRKNTKFRILDKDKKGRYKIVTKEEIDFRPWQFKIEGINEKKKPSE